MINSIVRLCLVVFISIGINAAEPRIQLNAILNDAAVLTINGQQILLKLNQTKNGVTLSQLMDAEAIITISGKQRRVKLGAAIGNYRKNVTTEVRIPKTNGMYISQGRINNISVTLLVDTGATVVAFNSLVANQVGIDYRNTGQPGLVNTAGGQVQAWRVTLDKVDIGGITMANVDAAVIEGEHPRFVLLGMSFLNQLKMNDDGSLLTLEQTF